MRFEPVISKKYDLINNLKKTIKKTVERNSIMIIENGIIKVDHSA